VNESNERLPDSEVARRGTRGVLAYLIRSGAGHVIQAASALTVARILSPTSYGVFALALTLIGLVRLFGDLGITLSLTVEREITERDLRGGCGVALAVAAVGSVLISVIWANLSMVQAAGHGAEWVVPVLTATLIIAVPADPSTIMMERRLEFSRLGVIGVVSTVALFSTQVLLLLAGLGIWAMVLAYTLGSSLASVLTVRASGRLYLPTIRAPIRRLVRRGLPLQGALIMTGVTGTVTNLVVAAQLGSRGIGFFAWCTILATPLMGAIAAMQSATAPTLARMRRDDGSRYSESAAVMTRAVGVVAAVGAGCLIGLAHPIIEYVFGSRWLPATAAVQLCLAGCIPLAICAALQADANARMERRLTFVASLLGGSVSLAVLVPLALNGGVGGASLAAFCVAPAVASAVFALGLRARMWSTLRSALGLFFGLTIVSFTLDQFVSSPLGLAAACVVTGCAAVAAVYLAERTLTMRILRQLRRQSVADPPAQAQASSPTEASIQTELVMTPLGLDNNV
jgi:O-antigen/teichoic acid export membrane protein